VLGYHVEIAQRHARPLAADPAFVHRQTMAGTMRFDTAELRALATRIAGADAQAQAAEAAHLEELHAAVVARAEPLSALAAALAAIDRSAALAALAVAEGWIRPRLTDARDFHIAGGRHPVVEAARRAAGETFVPNDSTLEDGCRLWLVTGPNMGGKSTFLRQNALIAVLAQAGSFVPATAATLGIVDRLFCRVGASDNLAEGRSTFMVEMVETAAILAGATPRSLLLLDEVGRGTATWDGLALAWAILESLHDRVDARCLFASHYHELTALAPRLPNLALRTLKVREWQGTLLFLHEIAEGAAPGSFGLDVARMAGIPAPVLARARDILARLESGDLGARTRDTLADLPLFASPPPAPLADPLRERLGAVNPDVLAPRDALDLLYELKALMEHKGA
jgi:DNA mismatch repair protein MutS